jgi:dihydroflavonol-4-reductase
MSKNLPTIVVTGATGFVGRPVIDRLLQESVLVKCLIRRDSDRNKFVPHDNLSFVIGDITAVETLQAAFNGAWGVINIAGLREFWSQDKKQFYKLNHIGASNVFKACLDNNIQHVVQVSTPLAFGAPESIPFNEDTPAGPHPSNYGRSKYLGDQAGLLISQKESLPLTILYLAAVIGAGDNKATMEVGRALKGNMPALIGADTTYTYLYVRDASEAIVRAIMKDETIGKQYLIGKERATTREYFSIIGNIAKVKVPDRNIPEKYLVPMAKVMEFVSRFSGKRPELPLDVLRTTQQGSLLFDGSLAEKELGLLYTPLSEALAEAIAYIQQHQKD